MTETARFSREEEAANAISHFTGAALSVIALILMIIQSIKHGDAWHIVSTSVFGATMITPYLSSGMTHSLKQGKLKNIFFSLDKIAIFFLIAGTYTPFALVSLQGTVGWIIFGIEWACALGGSYMVLKNPVNHEKGVKNLTVFIYAAMGWLIIFAIVPITKAMPAMGWILILLGGVFYSAGIIFFKKFSFTHHHLIWHLFVIAGSVAHFFAIYFYVIPRS